MNYSAKSFSVRASANVSSVTYNGTGYFNVNFSTAMPDTNYAMTFGMNSYNYYDGGTEMLRIMSNSVSWNGARSLSTSSVGIFIGRNLNGFGADADYVMCSVYR
jgi:hypothetical protein